MSASLENFYVDVFAEESSLKILLRSKNLTEEVSLKKFLKRIFTEDFFSRHSIIKMKRKHLASQLEEFIRLQKAPVQWGEPMHWYGVL